MNDQYEAVHVHCIDERGVIEEYREKGFVLKERTTPTIIAQMGFVKLIFVPAEKSETAKMKGVYLG